MSVEAVPSKPTSVPALTRTSLPARATGGWSSAGGSVTSTVVALFATTPPLSIADPVSVYEVVSASSGIATVTEGETVSPGETVWKSHFDSEAFHVLPSSLWLSIVHPSGSAPTSTM